LIRHFSDPKVGAVAGNVKVGNRFALASRAGKRWSTSPPEHGEARFRPLELHHRCGPERLVRGKKAIEAAAASTADTVAEDADLTCIRRLGWRVSYDEEAIAWTEASGNRHQLIRQRSAGPSARCNPSGSRRHAAPAKIRTLGWIALPNIFVFQLVLPLDFSNHRPHVLRLAACSGSWRSSGSRGCLSFGPPLTWKNRSSSSWAFCSSTYSRAWWPSPWSTRRLDVAVPVLLQRFYYRQLNVRGVVPIR